MMNLAGHKYGRWTVIRPAGKDVRGVVLWLCRCECGEERVVARGKLRSGWSRSCGCLMREAVKVASRTHGLCYTAEHRIWMSMLQRCTNPQSGGWKWYGARGVRVCDRWREDFAAFYADMGPRPSPDHSIDRINNDGHYEPSNCRWVRLDVQSGNRRNNRRLTYGGRTMTLAAWAKETGISRTTLASRLNTGWNVDSALTTPAGGKGVTHEAKASQETHNSHT